MFLAVDAFCTGGYGAVHIDDGLSSAGGVRSVSGGGYGVGGTVWRWGDRSWTDAVPVTDAGLPLLAPGVVSAGEVGVLWWCVCAGRDVCGCYPAG